MILSFSETVNARSLDISELTLQPAKNSSKLYRYTLVNGTAPLKSTSSTPDATSLVVNIGKDDMNEIKRITQLARNSNQTYLSFSSALVENTFRLPISPISFDNGERVALYVPDTSAPVLIELTFNLTSEVLSLTFDETVDVSTLNVSRVSVQSDVNGTTAYRLTEARAISAADSTVVHITMSLNDLHEIKLKRDLATEASNTWIRLRPGAVKDLAEQANENEDLVVKATRYGIDTTSPRLVNFSINMDIGTVAMEFDEPVDRSSLNVPSLAFQSSQLSSNLSTEHRLTGGFSPSEDGLEVVIYFTITDLNEIKRKDDLLTNLSTSFLVLDETFVSDMASNPVKSIGNGDAKQAELFISDESRAILTNYSLDSNTGVLELTFDETVDVSTFKIEQIRLQSSFRATQDANGYNVANSIVDRSSDSTIVRISISHEDLNALKARRIGLSFETSWLVYPSSALRDMNGNFVQARNNGLNSAPVSVYVHDTTPPALEFFDLIESRF